MSSLASDGGFCHYLAMRIAVIGCGGIGGVVAATLTRAGADVTPIVGNPAIARALGEHGYRVRELDGSEWSVKPSRAPILEAAQEAAKLFLRELPKDIEVGLVTFAASSQVAQRATLDREIGRAHV